MQTQETDNPCTFPVHNKLALFSEWETRPKVCKLCVGIIHTKLITGNFFSLSFIKARSIASDTAIHTCLYIAYL